MTKNVFMILYVRKYQKGLRLFRGDTLASSAFSLPGELVDVAFDPISPQPQLTFPDSLLPHPVTVTQLLKLPG